MTDAPLRPWSVLLRAPGIGPALAARLLDAFDTPAALLAASPKRWLKAGLEAKWHAGLLEPDEAAVNAELQWLAGPGRGLITRDDARYPAQLKNIAQAPVALYYQGDPDLLALPQIGVVGARSASPQGLENAQAFSGELARRGLVITSGLALGIDGAAHRGALAGEGFTVAVCATGLDRVYPARHRELALQIAQRGLLISEFPCGTPALAENFPRRNRLISGLSLGVLVVEAALQSGSLITARLASEQGREVFAIPGSIHNPTARGCHALIRQGAKLVETAEHVLEELGPRIGAYLREVPRASAGAAAFEPEQQQLLDALGPDTLSFDAFFERTRMPAGAFNAALLTLELHGEIAAAAGGGYARIHRRKRQK